MKINCYQCKKKFDDRSQGNLCAECRNKKNEDS